MLKDIRNVGKKNTPAPDTPATSAGKKTDTVQEILDDFFKRLADDEPDLVSALSKNVILKDALDEMFVGGVYSFDESGVIDKLEKQAPTPTRKGEQTKKNKNAKHRGKRGKGLKKPKIEI